MDYMQELESGSSPRIEKAAKKIIKNREQGYCSNLLNALKSEIDKPKAWKAQTQLIKAIGVSGCESALSYLHELIDQDFNNTILYRDLGFAIFILHNQSTDNLDFFYDSIKKGNVLQVAGVCAGILYKKIIPSNEHIKNILDAVSPLTQDEGHVISPRCYIAAVAHLWPPDLTKTFLESCTQSNSSTLVQIATSALQGKDLKIQLI